MVTGGNFMYKFSNKLILFLILFLFLSGISIAQQDCSSCHKEDKLGKLVPLRKPTSSFERGIGIMDKGQITNYLGNYGILSNFHEYFNESARWPKEASEVVHYSFGLGLVVASKGNVITSVVGGPADKYDWAPKDGSRGQVFSGDVTAPPPDETPFLPLSDNPETWPEGYFDENDTWVDTPGERHWPGFYRLDIDPESANYGEEVEGEFVSDRDIYCVFDDNENANPEGAIGIEVQQMAYTYGRPYAEDLLIWEYQIHNTSGNQLDSVYVGYYTIFRPDFDNEDNIVILDSDPNDAYPNGDFVYIYDINNTKDGAWEGDPTDMGIIGINILDTPLDDITGEPMGITDFHFFSREFAPKVDEEMWPIISSNPNYPFPKGSANYFHGSDRRMDTTHPDSMKVYFENGAPINFFIMTGPFTLDPGETVASSIGMVMGSSGSVPFEPDTTDLMSNMRTLQQMHDRAYQGSGPPKTPIVKVSVSDKQARIFWDSASEDSKDALTGKKDFEGYKIYRSDNQGRTWGDPITDQFGTVVGYKPLKIFDLIDGIKGLDPAFNQSLGDDSGLEHSFIDKNLMNGIEYWYCVTAYDMGTQISDSLEQSYQSPLGSSIMETHTAQAIPGVNPQNYNPPSYGPDLTPEGSFPPSGGVCNGLVSIDIAEPDSITGDNYLVTFVDSTMEFVGSDTNYVLGFNLYRIDAGTSDTTILLDHHLFSNDTKDNLPITDGFRITVFNSPSGIASQGWTHVNADTSTFYWNTKPAAKYVGSAEVVNETVYTIDDIQVTIDETNGLDAHLYDYFTGTLYDTTYHLPLKVEIITDPDNPIDISQNTLLMEFAVLAPWEAYRIDYYSQLGWDLIPGGNAFTVGSPGFYEKYIDVLNFEKYDIDPTTGDTTYTGLLLQTNHHPNQYKDANSDEVNIVAVPPSNGDQFTIKTYKPFRKDVWYEFSTKSTDYSNAGNMDLKKIRAVPDPYIVSNEFETSQFGKRLMFNNLPNECKISIFTVAGDFISEINHSDNKGYTFWDMRTYNDQYIAYGLYVFIVTLPNGQEHVGKFLVIK